MTGTGELTASVSAEAWFRLGICSHTRSLEPVVGQRQHVRRCQQWIAAACDAERHGAVPALGHDPRIDT